MSSELDKTETVFLALLSLPHLIFFHLLPLSPEILRIYRYFRSCSHQITAFTSMSVVIVSTITFILSTMPELTDDIGKSQFYSCEASSTECFVRPSVRKLAQRLYLLACHVRSYYATGDAREEMDYRDSPASNNCF